VQVWTPESMSKEEEDLVRRLMTLSSAPPQHARSKSFWSKMKEALGA
jgi:hypothetical protein